MRSFSSARWARWATCALAISVCVPAALADKAPKKSIADCTTFSQEEKGEDTIALKISNSCTIPVDCNVTWRVVCAPESAKRRAVHESSKKFSLTKDSEQSIDASASVCGDDAFSLDSIKWGCEPNKD
jgi:hypothetical protein